MKTIPIVQAHDACEEPSGEVRKLDIPLTRRSFLKGTGVLMGTIATTNALYALAPSPVWAAPLQVLSEEEGTTIMHMGRVLYPHDKLPDAVYALLAKDLDTDARGDSAIAAQLREGVKELHRAAGGKFTDASADKKLAIVTAIEGSPFFNTVRAKCVTSIYDNDMAYAVFGYPGASWDKGGYITRGFQDLNWLPEPPKNISPPPYFG